MLYTAAVSQKLAGQELLVQDMLHDPATADAIAGPIRFRRGTPCPFRGFVSPLSLGIQQ
ncbi:MAG TPA: hypothetical protein VE957_09600 [Terriglobales bacterium]|nr:hypothetical protein [Terriglobales bacterium]